MRVWMLTRGETNEGETVEGLYAERDKKAALIDFLALATDLHEEFGLDETSTDPKTGEMYARSGIDKIRLKLCEVQTKAQYGPGGGRLPSSPLSYTTGRHGHHELVVPDLS